MNIDIWKKIIELKIPSIVIIVVFASTTYFLLNDSPGFNSSKGIVGLVFGCMTVFFGIHSYISFSIGDHYERIVKNLNIALESISKTHSTYEEYKQNTLTKDSGTLNDEYISASDKSTPTIKG